MIYDCFPFFNEFELLTIRLHELASVVDKFVIVESDCTHAGHRKPLWFQEKKHLFRPWADKIVHAIASLSGNTAAEREQSQREWIWRKLMELSIRDTDVAAEDRFVTDKDFILMGDADEIPRHEAVVAAKNYANQGDIGFGQNIYQYHLNARIGDEWIGTRMASIALIKRNGWSMHHMRHKTPSFAMKNAGWHFGFMGGADRVRLKIQSYMHTEFNLPQYTDTSLIQKRINEGKDPFDRELTITSTMKIAPIEEMPLYVQQHPYLFANWLK